MKTVMAWVGLSGLSGVAALGCGPVVSPQSDGTGESSGASTGSPSPTGTSTASTSSEPGDTSGGSGGSSTTESPMDTSSDGAKFDVGGDDTGSACGGEPAPRYLWTANACLSFQSDCPHSSVSKIDMDSLEEVARYRTRPDGHGNPSRTSVNLDGDAVVANRTGGVTMIRTRLADCVDPDHTSSGPNDVRDWQDGCVAWHTPFKTNSQRPVAWTQGTWNDETCRHEGAMVWTAVTTFDSVEVSLLDGETGVIVETIPLLGMGTGGLGMGLYGAAVDGEGNLWANYFGDFAPLVRVQLEDLAVDTWPTPITGYGMTVDRVGRPWICSNQAARFDPISETFTVAAGNPDGGAGCMGDGNGRMWIAGLSLVALDLETMDQVASHRMPLVDGNLDTGYARGIGIDPAGYIWAPTHWANRVYRLDPDDGTFTWIDGVQFPYTYSDMTGFALANVSE